MKINRNTKKWKSIFNERLKYLVDLKGFNKVIRYENNSLACPVMGDAMPDRIKEAEEYADAIYKAMR